MVLSKQKIKEELHKIDLREIYRRYCGETELMKKEFYMIKNYDETHTLEEAIQLRIESLKEYQQIRQEKCKEMEIKQLVDLIGHEELGQEYLATEYEQMEQYIDNNEMDETVSFQPYAFDLFYQNERERT
ncbi:hypothetical protein EGW35_13175 [Enterococcus durans]|uniref:hypothetical protein n=1 Tax=Enterococcus TaxID=1350 RepID=UPI000F4EF73C|nr:MULTISPECIES: hypothetical protein [Enterococcus]ROX80048.1 hypothetical protein EGW35_13175 [Enterococcus durans]TKN15849.1 hypothetical protein DVW83_11500 [Enterococcus sp. VV15]